MKLRGIVSPDGVQLLNKEILPLLEKFSKTCALLLRPEGVHFILRAVDADGMQMSAGCSTAMFFEAGQFSIVSRYHNQIAFSFDTVLLRRVLAAVCRNNVEVLHMRLTMRTVQSGAGSQSRPFLSLETSSESSVHMKQDLPISSPFPPSEVDALVRSMDPGICGWYVDLLPHIQGMQTVTDKMKPLSGDAVTLALTRSGFAHLQVVAPAVQLGAEFRGLSILPAAQATSTSDSTMSGGAEARLEEALRTRDGCEVSLRLKHLQKALSASGQLCLRQLLAGIGDGSSHVHMMYIMEPRAGSAESDDDAGVELQLRIPVIDV